MTKRAFALAALIGASFSATDVRSEELIDQFVDTPCASLYLVFTDPHLFRPEIRDGLSVFAIGVMFGSGLKDEEFLTKYLQICDDDHERVVGEVLAQVVAQVNEIDTTD